jgi:hypothetical protein
MVIDGLMYETDAGDMLFDCGQNTKALAFPLAMGMTIEGAMVMADRIREQFPGCFMEFEPDDPSRDWVPDAKAAEV